MAFGKTLELIRLSKGDHRWSIRPVRASDKTPRDRSLRGKARIEARKARNKEVSSGQW